MKSAYLLLCYVTLLGHLHADDFDKRQLERLDQFRNLDWISWSIGITVFGGDYSMQGPKLVLQRLPDGRILLSKIPDPENALPIAIRFVTGAEAAAIRSTAIKILTQTIREENEFERMQKRGENQTPPGYQFSTISLHAKGKRVSRSVNEPTDSSSESEKALSKFLEESFKPNKANKPAH